MDDAEYKSRLSYVSGLCDLVKHHKLGRITDTGTGIQIDPLIDNLLTGDPEVDVARTERLALLAKKNAEIEATKDLLGAAG